MLKSCPFCGCEFFNFPEDHKDTCWFFVRYRHQFTPPLPEATEEELDKAWNTRAPDPRVERLIAAAEDFLECDDHDCSSGCDPDRPCCGQAGTRKEAFIAALAEVKK